MVRQKAVLRQEAVQNHHHRHRRQRSVRHRRTETVKQMPRH